MARLPQLAPTRRSSALYQARSCAGALQLWGLLVATLACLAMTLQLGHLTVVEHAVCALHGTVYHVDDQHPASGNEQVLRSDLGAVAGEQVEHDHEPCSAVAEAGGLTVEAPPPPLTLLSWQLLAQIPPRDRHAARADLLLLAPKTSPPA